MTLRTISIRMVAVASAIAGSVAGAIAQEPLALTLGAAVRLAATRAPGPEAARYRVAAAEARVRQQRADLLPTISGVFGETERTFNTAGLGISIQDPATGRDVFPPNGEVRGPIRSWDARGVLRQNIVDLSAVARVRAARAGVVATEAEAASASQLAAAAAAVAYVRALRSDALLAVRAADSTLAAELLGIAQSQLAAGMGIALDVTRARAQLATVHAQLIVARADRDRSRLDLKRALGLGFGVPILLADSLAGPPIDTAVPREEEAIRRAMRSRADVRMASAQLSAADRQTAAISAERFPALSAFADDGNTGKGTALFLRTYTWGVQLSVPVFDGFRREGRIAEQRAAARELDVRSRDLVRQLTLDVHDAILDFASAREQLIAASERGTLAEQEMVQARGRFIAGVAGNADLIIAQLGLNAARAQLVDAQATLQLVRVALARAQGTVTELP